jgi:hypothetical protein
MSILQKSVPAFSINPTYIACYNYWLEAKNRFSVNNHSEIFGNGIRETSLVPENNLHNGFLSDAGRKRLLKAIDWLIYISKPQTAWNYKTKQKFSFKLNFLTLTLPAKQMHTDIHIKSVMLNNFLTMLRQCYQIQHYIWRAEKQKNGNIHFHIIFNKFIHHEDVRNIWNKILDNHGYIEAYRENQKMFFQGKFKVREKLLNFFSLSAQKKAYKTGVRDNWCNPNTTDIHSTKHVRNLRNYFSKYLSKTPDISAMVGKEKLANESIEECKERLQKKLAVKGRLWFISQELSKLKNISGFFCNEIHAEVSKLFQKLKEKIITKEYVQIIPISVNELPALNCSVLFQYFQSKLKELIPGYTL